MISQESQSRSWTGDTRGLLLALALGIATLAPSLWSPLTLDDHFQAAWLRDSAAIHRPSWDLYRWVSGGEVERLTQVGHIPWWSDPRLRIAVFRPLSSLTRWLDHTALRDSVFAAHVHSMMWWACLVYLVWRGLARVIPSRERLFATILVASSPTLLVPIRWLADRNALISYVFMAAAWCVSSELDGTPKALWRVAILTALAALGGEIAWAVLPLLAALSVLRFQNLRKVISFNLAALAGVVSVLILSRALGYGIHHSGIYLDPFSQPMEFARQFPLRMALLATRIPTASLASLRLGVGAFAELMALPTLLLAVSLPLALLPARHFRAMMLCASVASLIPVTPAVPSLRLLFPHHVALLLFALVPAGHVVSWTRRGLAMTPIALILFGASLSTPQESYRLSKLSLAPTHLRSLGIHREDRVLLISTSMFEVFQHPDVIRRGQDSPRDWLVACSARSPVLVTRDDAQTLSLRSTTPLLHPADLYRSSRVPFQSGDRYRVGGTTITIRTVSEGRPTWLQIELDSGQDSTPWVILQASGLTLQRIPTLPIGGSIVVSPG